MDNFLYTPSNIIAGEDFSVHGEITLLSQTTEGGRLYRQIYFPAGEYGGISLMAYGMLCCPQSQTPHPLLMIIGNSRQSVDREIMEYFADSGYAVFMYDYLGEMPNRAKYTFYPPQIGYANFLQAGRKLDRVDTNVRQTAPYQWLLLSMRALSVGLSFAETDANSGAGVLGIGLGANTAWMLAALDKRVNALCTLFSAGWFEYLDSFKYDADAPVPQIDKERERWIAGLSVQAYVKNITQPVLYMTASNNRFTDMDRTYDTLSRLPSQNVYAYIAPGRSDFIGEQGGTNARLFFDKHLKGKNIDIGSYKTMQFTIKLPAQKDSDTEEVLPADSAELSLTGLDDTVKDFAVYYSLNQVNPGARYFYRQVMQVDGQEATAKVDVIGHKLLVAYAVLEFKNGFTLSLRPAAKTFDRPQSTDRPRRHPVVFNGAMGAGDFYNFFADTPTFGDILTKKTVVPQLKNGPGGIKGLLCKDGGVGTYKIGVKSFAAEEEESFKFDIYSAGEQSVCVYALDKAGYAAQHWHFACVELMGGEMWQPVEIKKQNLKTAEGQPVKNWKDISFLGFYCEGEILINNMLWF